MLVLLVLAVGINYMDRGSLSVAKPDMAREFNLDNKQMGLLLSAFFWSYSLCQLLAGWLVDRYDVKWVYAGGFLVWSLATAGMGLISGFAVFMALRLALGIGESVAYPATSRILATNFPEERRGFANALVDAGSKIGPALSTLIGGMVIAHFGWRALFLVIGLSSLLWLIPWLTFIPAQREPAPVVSATSTSLANVKLVELLVRREVWGTSLGMFCLGYVWAFLVTWLPSYLIEERGFTKEAMAVLGSLPFWAMAATSLTGGWFSDCWIRAGGSPTQVRKTFLYVGFGLCALFIFPAVTVHDPRWCIAFLVAACGSLGFYTSNVWAVTQTLAGSHAAGKWTGVQNAIGNFGGGLAPALTGWIVAETKSFYLAFATASAMLIVGIIAYLLLVGRIAPLTWSSEAVKTSPVNP